MITGYLENVEAIYGAACPTGSRATTDDLHRVIFRRLAGRYFPDRSARVLDIGVGLGHSAVALAELGYDNLFGIDIDGYYFDRLAESGIDVIRCDAASDRYPYEDGSIDVAVAFHIIEHFADPTHFLDEVGRVLAPGGIVLIATPDWKRDYKN